MTASHKARGKSGLLLMSCALLPALLPFSGCSTPEKEKEPVVSVQTAPAEIKTISQFLSAEAVVFPLQQAVVSSKITSTITEFKVQRGAHVRKGQLLAVLENRDLAAQAAASRGDYEQADANYAITVNSGVPQQVQKAQLDAEAAKSAFDAAQQVYDSRKDLYQQGAIPRRELDSADVALAQARSQNEQAQKQLADLQRLGKEQLLKAAAASKQSAEGHYRAAAAQLSYSEIRSPIDGVVTDRPLYVGDLAVANQPILTVMDTSGLVAKAHIPQTDAAQLKVGDAAEIRIPSSTDLAPGKVSLVSPALDPGSTTVEVWVETHKATSGLKPGMTAGIEITSKTVKDAVTVPSNAIFKDEAGSDYLLLAGTDGKAHRRPVKVGVRNSHLTQIVEGVKAGDPVIVSGGYAVSDATAIAVEKPHDEQKTDKPDNADPAKTDRE
jgi:multidrug efflux pump subunit AcrA (membrane-fusion protein)